MKIKELRQQSESELRSLLRQKKSENVEARFNVAGGNTKSVKQVIESRKTIAQIKTLLKEHTQHNA